MNLHIKKLCDNVKYLNICETYETFRFRAHSFTNFSLTHTKFICKSRHIKIYVIPTISSTNK